ncbi:flagellar biosynthetic protein FliO [Granulicella tundricola]|uniref:Flagellar biosynthesis protein FliO n=1 Tax=Granulicella tundricola (strain ATCC BAA-1859 / DSM 23138 / MP5ACTX9) TaxID=1198114 RepID=E8X633_GRATM|nr:flagellar biosynthetic protein FliO [Granulicella tundricola]ADW70917.1 hypothetical protein AciX9_4137 [Granulicella tundricola MP5ACTX9]
MSAWQAVARTEDNTSLLDSVDGTSALHGVRSPLGQPITALRPLIAQLTSAWKWLEQKRTQQIATRRLKVAETVSLGEKRFVSILQVDGAQFLIGGAAGNVTLLAILDKQQDAVSMEQPS